MSKKEEVIDFKIGSKEEKFYTDTLEKVEKDTFISKMNIEINEIITDFLKKRIEEEKEKFSG